MKQRFETFYNKNYKKFLILSAILIILAISYTAFFYFKTGDIINKDVSLTGGTTVTILTDKPISEFKQALSEKYPDLVLRSLSDDSGRQTSVIVIVPDNPDKIIPDLEAFLSYELTPENSSTEFTGSSLSEDFYKQLIVAVLFAFFLMAAVVFFIVVSIFNKKFKLPLFIFFLTLLLGFLLRGAIINFNVFLFIISLAIMAYLIYAFIKHSIPSFAVILSAFADIVITLAVIDMMNLKISTAGIVAFLMLIGYSVDTDIMLVSRVLRRREHTNQIFFDAFKTGATMTITSIIALISALIVVYSLESVLNQIFIILIIGLTADLFSTWVTNASIIKWYFETK